MFHKGSMHLVSSLLLCAISDKVFVHGNKTANINVNTFQSKTWCKSNKSHTKQHRSLLRRYLIDHSGCSYKPRLPDPILNVWTTSLFDEQLSWYI